MAVRNSLFSAMCVAGLLGVVAVLPAAAITNTITVTPPAISTSPGGTVVFTVVSTTSNSPAPSKFTGGLTLTGPASAWLVGSLPVYTGQNTTKTNTITFTIPTGTASGDYVSNFSFTSVTKIGTTNLNGGANQDFVITVVPEPGAVAFGVLAAGSVLGLVARKRRKA